MNKEKVFVKIDSGSLGDSLAWCGIISDYQKRYNVEMTVCCSWNHLFKNSYPNINFVDSYNFEIKKNPTYNIGGFDDAYSLGCYEEDEKLCPEYLGSYRKLSLQNMAAGILGYQPYTEKDIKTKLTFPETDRLIKGKTIIIGTQSTAQLKYWNNPGAWDVLCKKLRKKGYTPVCIDKYDSFGDAFNINHMPKSAVDRTGLSVEDTIPYIAQSEFFIGLSSGISWLAWALNKKVYCIAGHTPEYYHPEDWNMIENRDGCYGCFGKHVFDKGDWMFCPEKKNFECTREITPDMVMERIEGEAI